MPEQVADLRERHAGLAALRRPPAQRDEAAGVEWRLVEGVRLHPSQHGEQWGVTHLGLGELFACWVDDPNDSRSTHGPGNR